MSREDEPHLYEPYDPDRPVSAGCAICGVGPWAFIHNEHEVRRYPQVVKERLLRVVKAIYFRKRLVSCGPEYATQFDALVEARFPAEQAYHWLKATHFAKTYGAYTGMDFTALEMRVVQEKSHGKD